MLKYKRKKNKCNLLISDFSEQSNHRFLYIFKRWIPLILNISGSASMFSLSVTSYENKKDPFEFKTLYRLSKKVLELMKFEFVEIENKLDKGETRMETEDD